MEALRKKPTAGESGPSSESGTHAHEGSCDAARSAKPSAITSKAAGVSVGLPPMAFGHDKLASNTARLKVERNNDN